MICISCETMYPDMCPDCAETIHMSIPQEHLDDDFQMFMTDVKKYIGSGEDVQLEMMGV